MVGQRGLGGEWRVMADGLQPDEITEGRRRSRRNAGGRTAPDGIGVGDVRPWIASGAQECVAKARPGGYVIEWAIRFDPCLEVEPGVFYSTAMGDRRMGLNILIGDLDRDEFRSDNPYGFHHENSWAGSKNTRTHLRDFGTRWCGRGSGRRRLPTSVRSV